MTIDVIAVGSICAAIVSIIAVIKYVIKPFRDVTKKLDDVSKELRVVKNQSDCNLAALEKQEKVNQLHMKTQYVILEHLQTNNATGKMAKCSEELKNYLITIGSSIH